MHLLELVYYCRECILHSDRSSKGLIVIKVNEIYGPVQQGEGKSVGEEVLFLRLAECNLHCRLCDTDFTWRFDGKHSHANNTIYLREVEVHLKTDEDVFDQLHNLAYYNRPITTPVKRIVVSGGEPMLQQKQLIPLLQKLKQRGYFVEVETNGTVAPNPEFISLVDQVNCSPKLDGLFSGESRKLRIRESALKALSMNGKTNFKFVISEPENLEEALQLIQMFEMKEVFLMPEGRTKEEIQNKKGWVQELCQIHNLNFSTRRHVELWGNKRGV